MKSGIQIPLKQDERAFPGGVNLLLLTPLLEFFVFCGFHYMVYGNLYYIFLLRTCLAEAT